MGVGMFFLKETDMDVRGMYDAELLCLLLGKETARRVASRSLREVFEGGLQNLEPHPRIEAARELVTRWLREELASRDVFARPDAIRDYLRALLRGKEHEVFIGLYLDAQNHLIAMEELFRGTLAQTSVYPREIVKAALRHNAASVVFAHNHPSGVAEPSRADEALTQSLKQVLALVDVRVLDHFVVAGPSTMSFAERGLL
jgi:DNA repair protein RadC